MTSDTSPRPVSPLRARMIEDMTMRGFNEHTRRDYVRHVRGFAAFIGRSPDMATAEDLRLFQLRQTQSGMQPPSINSAVSALRFFFTVTLDRPDLARRLTIVPYPRRIPAVLSVEEVTLLLQAASAPKYKAAFALAYGAGLARLGSCRAQGRRHRFQTHAAARRTRQGRQGPSRDAVAAAARTFACLVARGAAAQPAVAGRLAVSRPQPGRAAVGPPALPRCPRRRPGRRDQQARLAAHVAAQLRHPPSRARCRYSRDPDAFGPRQARYHGAIHSRRQCDDPCRHQPTRPARTIDQRERATRGLARRRCAARSWRSQTSLIAMGPTGARPMPDM